MCTHTSPNPPLCTGLLDGPLVVSSTHGVFRLNNDGVTTDSRETPMRGAAGGERGGGGGEDTTAETRDRDEQRHVV